MKRGNCLPVSGWMFEQDAIKMKLRFHQVAQERMTRTINAIAALRPECILNTLSKDMRYYIGVCAGRDYQDMTLENAITIKVKVEVEILDGVQKVLSLPGFDYAYLTQQLDFDYEGWSITFLCWNPTVQILVEIMNHVMALLPNELFATREYGVEFPRDVMENFASVNGDDLIKQYLIALNEHKAKLITIIQWFGPFQK